VSSQLAIETITKLCWATAGLVCYWAISCFVDQRGSPSVSFYLAYVVSACIFFSTQLGPTHIAASVMAQVEQMANSLDLGMVLIENGRISAASAKTFQILGVASDDPRTLTSTFTNILNGKQSLATARGWTKLESAEETFSSLAKVTAARGFITFQGTIRNIHPY
jgi:hypothetical protein